MLRRSPSEPKEPSAKLYVSNINKDVTEEELRTKFLEFGRIRSLTLKKKDNYVTFCFIEYESQWEAGAAIEKMNKALYLDRVLKVEYAKSSKKTWPNNGKPDRRDALYNRDGSRFGRSSPQRRRAERSKSDSSDSYRDRRRYHSHSSSSSGSHKKRNYDSGRYRDKYDKTHNKSRSRDGREHPYYDRRRRSPRNSRSNSPGKYKRREKPRRSPREDRAHYEEYQRPRQRDSREGENRDKRFRKNSRSFSKSPENGRYRAPAFPRKVHPDAK